MTPKYQVGGLASGIDTMSIIDQFVSLQQAPIAKVQQRQALVRSQISALGDISSRLNSLASSVKELSTNGVRATSITSTTTGFTATSNTSALPGSYAVEVISLARAAKAKSDGFDTENSPVTGGTLGLSINGSNYNVTLTDGMSLKDAAKAINASGAPVNASIINTGSQSYLSIVNRNTGFTVGADAGTALQITETYTGTQGKALNAAIYESATNAKIEIDGQTALTVERNNNTMDDVLPGVSLTLKSAGATENLTIAQDSAGSTARIQGFVAAMKNVYDRIDALTTNTTEREGVLAGDSGLRAIKNNLKKVVTQTVSNAGTFKNLGDIGLSHDRYGNLNLDSSKFSKALQNDPNGVNALFSEATNGVYATIKTAVDQATSPSTGILKNRQDSLNRKVRSYDDQIERMNKSLEAYRSQLQQQFSSMEETMSGLKSIGNFLSMQEKQLSAGKK